MNTEKHLNELLSNLNSAYALFEIVLYQGKPMDYILHQANSLFFDYIIDNQNDALKQRISEISDGSSLLDLLIENSDVAIEGNSRELEYSGKNNRKYSVKLYSPEKNYIAALFDKSDDNEEKKVHELEVQKDEFEKISQVSLNFSRIDSKYELFDYTSKFFAKNFTGTIILINEAIDKERYFILRNISGIDEKSYSKIKDEIEFDPIGRPFPIIDKLKKVYKEKSLYEYTDGFNDFSETAVDQSISEAIVKMTGISKIYTIGLKSSNKLLGSIHFLAKNDSVLKHKNYIKSITFQISANLERIKTKDKLLMENDLFRKGKIVIFKWQNLPSWPAVYVSENVSSLLGYTVSNFYSSDVYYGDLIHKDDLAKVNEEVKAGLASNENLILHQPYRIYKKDGSIIWVHDFTTIIRNAENEAEYMLGYIYDVTKDKENEIKLSQSLAEMQVTNKDLESVIKELEDSEIRWKFALEGSHSGVWDWDLQTNEVFFSKQWKNILGFEEDEIDANLEEWENRVHPDDLDMTYKKIKNHLKMKTEIYSSEHRLLCKDGSYKWVLDRGMVVNRDDNGNPLRMIGTHLDLTERIQQEEKIKRQKEKLQKILKISLDGFFINDLKGNFLDANDAYSKMVGYSYSELMDMSIPDVEVIESKEDVEKHIKIIMDTGSDRFITKHRAKNGNVIDIEISVHLLESDGQMNIFTFCRDITEQIKSEIALRESRKQLESFFSQSLDGFFFMMLDEPVYWNDDSDKEKLLDYIFNHQRMTKVNDAVINQYGVTREDFIGLTPSDFFMDEMDEVERGRKTWRKFFDDGKLHIETKEKKFDGTDMWVEGDYVCLYDDEGRITGHFGIQRDVTEQKISQQKLQEEEEKFRQLTDHIDEVFWLRNAENDKIIYVSPAYEDIWGMSCQSLYDDPNSFLETVHADDKEMVLNEFQSSRNINEGYFDIEYRIIRPDGEVRWIWVRAFPVKDNEGRLIRRAGIGEDITKRKEINQKLRDNEERYRGLIESQTDLIVRVDNENRFTYVNDTYCNTFGKTREELIGNIFTPLVHEDDLEATFEAMKMLEVPPYRATIEQKAKTVNGWRWFAWEDNAILDQKGNIVEVQGVGRDITEIKEAESKALEANRAKSEFLANMSHEIRTPMNSILGFSEILLNTVENPQHKDYLSTILSSGKTLLSLINDILDLSKIEAGKMEIFSKPVDITQVINEMSSVFSQRVLEKGIDLSISIDEDFPKVIEIDEIRLRQILLNLIGNAVKFTNNGKIRLIARTVRKENDIIDFALDVQDSGIGIKSDLGEKIFEAFTQQMGYDSKKYGGTGLGLAISKRLTNMMNGKLYYESEEGEGSIFTVVFKDCRIAERIDDIEDPYVWDGKDIEFNESKLLVVDDVEYNRDIVKAFLLKSNIEIIEAENGEIAIEMIRQHRPDIVLMDLRMPEMNGMDATEIIKNEEDFKDMPVIAFTASILKREEDSINDLFDDTLRKPVMKKDLVKTLTKYLQYSVKKDFKKAKNHLDHIAKSFANLPAKKKVEIKNEYENKYKDKINEMLLLMDFEEIRVFWQEFKNICENENIPALEKFYSQMIEKIDNFDYNAIEKNLKFIKDILEEL